MDKTRKVTPTGIPVAHDGGGAKLKVEARGKGERRLEEEGRAKVNPRVLFETEDGRIGKRREFKLRMD